MAGTGNELSIQEVIAWIQTLECPKKLELVRNTAETRRTEVIHKDEWGAGVKASGQRVTVPGAAAQP